MKIYQLGNIGERRNELLPPSEALPVYGMVIEATLEELQKFNLALLYAEVDVVERKEEPKTQNKGKDSQDGNIH